MEAWMRILHVDDDPLQLELTARWLEPEGHALSAYANGADAIKAVQRDSFDLAILDWMIPDVSGEEVLRWIRQRNAAMPVMFVTANDEESEIAHILGLGADDYLVKPLRRLEFLARIAALARRAGHGGPGVDKVIEAGAYVVDLQAREVRLHGRAVAITPRMAGIAMLLFRKRGEIVSRSHIYEEVWGRREQLETRTVDTHVSRLRTALELDGRHGWRLSSVYQHGYRLEEAAE
jgi:two-component system, OmpR family, response regulator RegX3